MEPALNEDARATVDRLRHRYGAVLFDYCHTTLATADAELAACAALTSAHAHADRLTERRYLRAWLYALARVHCTTSSRPASWPGITAAPLLREAVRALPATQLEVLNLSVRHGLSDLEIATIFDAGALEIEYLVTNAIDQIDRWISTNVYPDLPDEPAPHTARALLTALPIADEPPTMTARLASAPPLGADTRWRADGFPEQKDPFTFAPVRRHEAGETTTRQDDFRAWERRSRRTEEFWTRRHDESNPEAHLSLRPLAPALRVGAMITAAVTSILAAGALWSWLQPESRPTDVHPAAAPATITVQPSQSQPAPLIEEPPPNRPTTPAPTKKPTATKSPSPTPTKKPSRAVPGTHPAPEARILGGPQDPPTQDDPTRSPRKLPKPPPPTASLAPSTLALGTTRSGTFRLACTGTCQVVSATGSPGITVSGTRVTVSAPTSQPGCASSTENGTVTISWTGTTTGDGRTSAGTTTASGALTLRVTWTVEADRGYWVATGPVSHVGDRQGFWINCPS
ncbi:hypothetical protein ACFFR3_19090 [Nonomuraea salmonea]|uniref:Uncharacterized protein n=1 Tax=Nonomuraea salmonea TaxID=46181 RepID=A0ABV5NMV7_9ACTN